jgi:P27 family predicted phage terminase small subunit
MAKVIRIPRKQGRPKKSPNRAKVAPKPIEKVPRAPLWLSKAAQAEWRRAAAVLTARKVLSEADLMPLAAYCSAAGRLIAAEGVIQNDGLFVTDPQSGKRLKHPAVSIANEAAATVKALGTQLGLTPVSRRRAAQSDDRPEDDRWGDLLE